MADKKYNPANKFMKFKGLVSYCKLYEPDEYLNKKQWKVNLHPDPETIAKIKAAGIQLKLKDSNEEKSGVPGKFFTFNRNASKEFDGVTQVFAPPTILDKDGKKLVSYNITTDGIEQIGEKVIIGNGSLVELDVLIYQTQKFGKGQRIQTVKILDLVEYVPQNYDDTEVQDEEVWEEESVTTTTRLPAKVTTSPAPTKKVSW